MRVMLKLILLTYLKLISADHSAHSKLVEKALYVTNKYYEHRFVTAVVWTNNDSEGVTEFLRNFPGSVEIIYFLDNSVGNLNINRGIRYRQTIIFATEPEAFNKFITSVNQNLRYAIQLVLVLEKSTTEPSDLSPFFRIAWKNNLVDMVIVSADNNEDVTFSIYYPFKEGICGNYVPVTLEPGENIFPNKLNNFNKCPIRASTINLSPFVDVVAVNGVITEVRGYDGITLTLIADKLNATLDIKEASDHNIYGSYTNGTATGAFKDLVLSKADILIPGGFLILSRYSGSVASHIFRNVDIRWVGPRRREIYQWMKVLIPFANGVTPFLCLSFILFVIVVLLINKRIRYRGGTAASTCFQAFGLLLSQTVRFVTKVPLLNNLFLLWIWFCLIIRIVYQGDLVDSLQNRIYLEAPFDGIEEAVTRVDGFGGAEVFLDYYRGTSLENDYQILSLPVSHSYIKRVSEGKRFLIATDTLLVRNFRYSIQILERQISSASTCYYMRPGWPAASTIDSIIIQLIETGYVKKLLKFDIDKQNKLAKRETKARPLNMTMFVACFYGMGFMFVVCSVVFIAEVVYHKWTHNRRCNYK